MHSRCIILVVCYMCIFLDYKNILGGEKMKSILKIILCISVCCALISMSAFAALIGTYSAANNTFTVSGGAGENIETSLVIVEGDVDALNTETDGTITGAVYTLQITSTASGAVFTNVNLSGTKDVFSAFFADENTDATKQKITTYSIAISADKSSVTEGSPVLISAVKTDSVTDANTKAYVNGVETAFTGNLSSGLTYTPDSEGNKIIKLVSTIGGVEVSSNEVTVAVAKLVIEPESIDATRVLGENKADITAENSVAATPVAVKVNFSTAGMLGKMKWVFVSSGDRYYSDTITMNDVNVSGETAFAAIIPNGKVQSGAVAGNILVDRVEAIFQLNGVDYFTDVADADNKN